MGMRIVFWGTYDSDLARNRFLLKGLRENGVDVIECRSDVWGGRPDKSQIARWSTRLHLLLKWICSYPGLIVRYLRLPGHDAVMVGYLGQLDVVVLWLFSRLRGVPIVWDLYLSLFTVVVEQRQLIRPSHPFARVLFAWEWLAFRMADLVLTLTRNGAEHFRLRFGVAAERVQHLWLGAETEAFPMRHRTEIDENSQSSINVLFYGLLLPSHGTETIIRAARLTEDRCIDWVLIGSGQEEPKIRQMLEEHPLPKLKWIPWVPYTELATWIHRADICLGIFGEAGQAHWGMPNKVYQVLCTGTPLITRDSPGIRELLSPDMPGIYLVPPTDPQAIVQALGQYEVERDTLSQRTLHRDVVKRFQSSASGQRLLQLIKRVIEPAPRTARSSVG